MYSFPDENGICVTPTIPITGCYSYSADGECQESILGFFRDNVGMCYPLSKKLRDSCALSTISTISCNMCMDSSLTVNGICPSTRKCSDKLCEVCLLVRNKEACFICKNGGVLIGDDYNTAICVEHTPIMIGCFYSPTMDYCTDCNYGYYFKNYQCIEFESLDLVKAARIQGFLTLILLLLMIF